MLSLPFSILTIKDNRHHRLAAMMDERLRDYVNLFHTVDRETRMWLLKTYYHQALEPEMAFPDFVEKMTTSSLEEEADMHQRVLAHFLMLPPQFHDQLHTITLPPNEQATIYLHCGAILQSGASLCNDKQALKAVFEGLSVDALLRVLHKLLVHYPLQPSVRENVVSETLMRSSITLLRPMLNSKLERLSQPIRDPFLRAEYLDVFMTSHLGDSVVIRHNEAGRVLCVPRPGGPSLRETQGTLIEWIPTECLPMENILGGEAIIKRDNGTLASFEFSHQIMNLGPDRFVCPTGAQWVRVGKWNEGGSGDNENATVQDDA